MIMDRIVLGVSDSKVQTELLKCRDLTLDNCIDICKASESALAQNRVVRPSEQVNKMSGYEKNGFKKEGYRLKPRQTSQTSETRMCKFCGESHKMEKRTVPSIWTNMHKMWPKKPETVCHLTKTYIFPGVKLTTNKISRGKPSRARDRNARATSQKRHMGILCYLVYKHIHSL